MVGRCYFQAFWMGSKPVRSNFFIFLEPRKKSEKNFSRKNRYLSEKSAIFLRFFYFRFFHPKIFSSTTENRFFTEKSAEKNNFFVHATTQSQPSPSTPSPRDGIRSDLDRIFQNPYPILNKNNISISISIYYG